MGKLEKAKIWMDVTCGNCGAMAGRTYRNGQSIQRLKEETFTWRYDTELCMNLCTDCLMKLRGGQQR